jgi:hypothetical protein
MTADSNNPARKQLDELVKTLRRLGHEASEQGLRQEPGKLPPPYWYGRADSYGHAADLLTQHHDAD